MFYNVKITRRKLKTLGFALLLLALLWFLLSYQVLQNVLAPSRDRAIYRVEAEENIIALTFDVVWSDQYTLDLLTTLDRYDLKATFFVTGKWMEKYPDLTEEFLKRGHEVGNHTYSHAHLKDLEEEEIREEIGRVDRQLQEGFDYQARFFRPPFGEYDQQVLQVAEEMGYYTVLWSIETGDWANPGVDKIIDRVVKRVHRGGIILLHNCSPQGVKALPMIIHGLKMRNYQVLTMSEMLDLGREKEVVRLEPEKE